MQILLVITASSYQLSVVVHLTGILIVLVTVQPYFALHFFSGVIHFSRLILRVICHVQSHLSHQHHSVLTPMAARVATAAVVSHRSLLIHVSY
jgi:hypothetical protein